MQQETYTVNNGGVREKEQSNNETVDYPDVMERPQQTSARHSYFGGVARMPDRATTQKYMRGDCGHFALAMARIVKQGQLWQVGVGHFAVSDELGQFWDARGCMTIEQLWSGLDGLTMRKMSANEVRAELDSGAYGDSLYVPGRVRKARGVIMDLIGPIPALRSAGNDLDGGRSAPKLRRPGAGPKP